ncbi:MAG: protoglobin domain-containing protein [Planctomycetia bacterium]|nr:protoglobin domain-containing protein [Planctomycetia bacterium]
MRKQIVAFELRVDELFERYQDIQRYVAWTTEDAERVRVAGAIVELSFDELADDFYREIAEHEATRKVITGGGAQVARLKVSLRTWLHELVTGPYDLAYAERRFRVGYRHVKIGLKQIYVEAAVSRLRNGLLRSLRKHWPMERGIDELAATMRSMNTLLDLDLAIIQDAYEAASNDRLMQVERLAALGRVAGGVAHELRNPLNVMRTSVYFLRNAKNAAPEKIAEHLERIERQVALSDSVITALSEFAKLASPNLQPMSVPDCLKNSAALESRPENVELINQVPLDLPHALADDKQLSIVFDNLIRNACEAMPTGGRLTLSAQLVQHRVEVSVNDTGCGIAPENLPHIREPFRSTKPRGIGLGLALSQAILEKNRSTLNVTSELGRGSTFTVVLECVVRKCDD